MAGNMKAWQYTTAAGGLETNLYLPATGIPKPHIGPGELLIEVYYAALNPVDHKIPELGVISKVIIKTPATPGMDFCGRVAETGSKIDSFSGGEMVFGTLKQPTQHGSLAQYMVVPKESCVTLPEGVSPDQAAAVGVAGLTAYQSIQPHVKSGDKVFINGGSGGTGVWGIQIAKALGCHVTTSCSGANAELCKSIGADEVLDYKERDILKQLEEKGPVFALCIDNIGTPTGLYKAGNSYLLPTGKFIAVGMAISLSSVRTVASNVLTPGFLGGGTRKYSGFGMKLSADDIGQVGAMLAQGKIKAVIDEVFEFDNAPEAFKKVKSHRAKGKILVRVKKE